MTTEPQPSFKERRTLALEEVAEVLSTGGEEALSILAGIAGSLAAQNRLLERIAKALEESARLHRQRSIDAGAGDHW